MPGGTVFNPTAFSLYFGSAIGALSTATHAITYGYGDDGGASKCTLANILSAISS
jgi:hypothetical protein